jgi:hypothetical protein
LAGVRVGIPRVADGFCNLKLNGFLRGRYFHLRPPFLFWIEMDKSDYNNHNILSCGDGIKIKELLNKSSVESFAGFCPTKANHHLVLLEKFQIFQAWSIK